MIDVGRRRFFGLLAAPAIISITGKLQPAERVIWRVAEEPVVKLVPAPAEVVGQRIGLNYQAFKRIIEPVLREHFEEHYKAMANDPLWMDSNQLGRRFWPPQPTATADAARAVRRDVEAERRRLERGAYQERRAPFVLAPRYRRMG